MSTVLSSLWARVEEAERTTAVEALKVARGSIVAAAQLCGINRCQMRRIVNRYELQGLLRPASRARRDAGGNAAWRALADA